MKRIEKLEEEVKKYFTHPSHGFDHVQRVCNLAAYIAEKENINLEQVKAAALLHDIARTDELNGKKECHAKKGAKMAEPILKRLDYSSEDIKIINDAISKHRYKNGLIPDYDVGKVIQDADRLDLLGAIGIARIFTRTGETGAPMHDPNIQPDGTYRSGLSSGINHFYEKVFKIDPDSFHTDTAKQIAEKRYQYTKEFVDTFLKEWEGDYNG